MTTVKAGKPLIDFVKLCYAANRPPLLVARHGIGKSELLEQAAASLGIGYICRDLSLLEAPDLIGLPKIAGGNTIYAPPAFLPRNGRGLLVFEELNRADRTVRAPCLQLLTARVLNDYRLPDGWLPAAAINPADNGDYEVSDLDPALLSRFCGANVVADRKEWLTWAASHSIHADVVGYVESDPHVFDHPDSNPRSWRYISDLLKTAESDKTARDTLRAAIVGQVGDNLPDYVKHLLGGRWAGTRSGSDQETVKSQDGALDWICLLRRYVGQTLEARRDYLRPARRFARLVGVVPGKRRLTQLPRIMAVIDTSGSMTGEILARISGELCRMAAQYKVTVVECDCEIKNVYAYKPITQVSGRGGTSFLPPLESSFLRKHQPDLIVFFTDGFGPAPEHAPRAPVIWCLTPEGLQPVPWGRVIQMKEYVP